MPRTTRRRATEVATASQKQSIGNFTKVSKGLASVENTKATKQPAQPVAAASSKKRKAATIDDDVENQAPAPAAPEEAVSKRVRVQEPVPAAPTPQKTINTELKWPAKSTSKTPASRRHASNDVISKSKQQGRGAISKRALDHQKTKKEAAAVKAKKKDALQLPPALLELLDMHAAFIKTLIIHIAHNKAATPIDVRNLAPDVSRSWGKRNVTVEDLQRCLAIHGLNDSVAPFILADYGRGKICVEMSSTFDGRVDEQELCRQFKNNLTALCNERAQDEATDVDVCMESLSIADLPQAPITSMKISAAANPLLAKGHRALIELKSGLASKNEAPAAPAKTTPESGPKLGLLDRLRLKQLAKAQGPLPPSGPELERRAALQRVEDIAAVISMLSLQTPLSLPRQAYAMPTLVQRVRDSLKLPISSEEAIRCVKILANEVAPGWIKIMTIGGRDNVVVQRGGQPVDRVIREKVDALLG